MRSYLDTQGLLRTQIAIENQLLTGNGAGGGLTGFYNRTVNSVPIGTYSPAGATDNNGNALTNVDIIAKGVNATRVNGVCDPSLVVIHTSDLLAIRLLKNSFGQYIYGNPSDLQDVRIWGVPIYETPRAVLGSPLTGDFTMHSSMVLFPNMPLTMEYARVGNDRVNLEWTLVIYMRAALQLRRALAFTVISGLTQ
jgi:HK97 family phage major capsid protein